MGRTHGSRNVFKTDFTQRALRIVCTYKRVAGFYE